jgi:hypothetical protein
MPINNKDTTINRFLLVAASDSSHYTRTSNGARMKHRLNKSTKNQVIAKFFPILHPPGRFILNQGDKFLV